MPEVDDFYESTDDGMEEIEDAFENIQAKDSLLLI